jgi:hypothetical protein
MGWVGICRPCPRVLEPRSVILQNIPNFLEQNQCFATRPLTPHLFPLLLGVDDFAAKRTPPAFASDELRWPSAQAGARGAGSPYPEGGRPTKFCRTNPVFHNEINVARRPPPRAQPSPKRCRSSQPSQWRAIASLIFAKRTQFSAIKSTADIG